MSDHILGHIYAEIQKILKGSQTLKQHCISVLQSCLWDQVWDGLYLWNEKIKTLT